MSILLLFFPLSFCLSLDYVYYPVFNLTDSFLSYIQSTDVPVREVLQLWYHVFYFYHFYLMFSISWNSQSGHTCCLPFPLGLLTYNHSYFKFPDSFNTWVCWRLLYLLTWVGFILYVLLSYNNDWKPGIMCRALETELKSGKAFSSVREMS